MVLATTIDLSNDHKRWINTACSITSTHITFVEKKCSQNCFSYREVELLTIIKVPVTYSKTLTFLNSASVCLRWLPFEDLNVCPVCLLGFGGGDGNH